MSPDVAADDGSSALFLALQNPVLSKAASVLLRSMQETGSVSDEDATLMSAFLSSCDVPQPDDVGGASGNNKRARDATSDLDGDDEIVTAAAARTVTAQIPDSEWVSEARECWPFANQVCFHTYTIAPPHKLMPCMQLLTHAGTKSDQEEAKDHVAVASSRI